MFQQKILLGLQRTYRKLSISPIGPWSNRRNSGE